jgi:hypothetical protein
MWILTAFLAASLRRTLAVSPRVGHDAVPHRTLVRDRNNNYRCGSSYHICDFLSDVL